MSKSQNTPKKKSKPKVHKDLQGFEMNIDSFGEITSNMNIEKINEFLNKNVTDKKLEDREADEPSNKRAQRKKK